MKRADVTTGMVLAAIMEYGHEAAEHLVGMGYPPKVVLAALRREVDRGLLDYGTSEWHPWIDASARLSL